MVAITPEGVLVIISYISTFVATLRATSRGLYLLEHGRIGIMDGPRILGPDDVRIRRKMRRLQQRRRKQKHVTDGRQGEKRVIVWEDGKEEDAEEETVSPLWGSTYAFREAVRLALEQDRDDKNYYRIISSQQKTSEKSSSASTDSIKVQSKLTPPRPSAVKHEKKPKKLKQKKTMTPREPYSLSPYPTQSKSSKEETKKKSIPVLIMTSIQSAKDTVVSYISLASSMSIETMVSYMIAPATSIGHTISSWTNMKWATTGSLDEHDRRRRKRRKKNDDNGLDETMDFKSIISSTIAIPTVQVDSDNNNVRIHDKQPKTRAESSSSTSAKRVAHIEAYAPKTFAKLRARFGIKEEEFCNSLLRMGPYVSFQSNSKGAARVGGFFFFTADGAYMVKTVKKEEAGTFLAMLPKYYKFMRRNARRSLLTRFCGMYSVRLSDSASTNAGKRRPVRSFIKKILPHKEEEHVFVVMNSIFPVEGSMIISERFDLKGSTVGRECSAHEREKSGKTAVLKDLDLHHEIQLVRSRLSSRSLFASYGINIGARAKAKLLSQLRRDVSFLADSGVMDYSLLIGVVHVDDDPFKSGTSGAMVPYTSNSGLTAKADSEIGLIPGEPKRVRNIFLYLLAPIRLLAAPPLLVYKALSTMLTVPVLVPYYGAGICGVDGGDLSVVYGRRLGHRVVYYMGLIDFLQPWTMRKVLERELKGLIGYDTKAISCVAPKEYSTRFLDFISTHVT